MQVAKISLSATWTDVRHRWTVHSQMDKGTARIHGFMEDQSQYNAIERKYEPVSSSYLHR